MILLRSIARSARQIAFLGNWLMTSIRSQSHTEAMLFLTRKWSIPSGRTMIVRPPPLNAASCDAMSTPGAYPETTVTSAALSCDAQSAAICRPYSLASRDPQNPTAFASIMSMLPTYQIPGGANSPKAMVNEGGYPELVGVKSFASGIIGCPYLAMSLYRIGR